MAFSYTSDVFQQWINRAGIKIMNFGNIKNIVINLAVDTDAHRSIVPFPFTKPFAPEHLAFAGRPATRMPCRTETFSCTELDKSKHQLYTREAPPYL